MFSKHDSWNTLLSMFFFSTKIKFFDSSLGRNREDLSIHVSFTNVGLILTKLRWFQLFWNKSKFNFELFRKEIQVLGFSFCSTCEYLSIDVSITNVGLILMKLRWFQLFSRSQNTRQNSITNFFEKKLKCLCFHGVVLVKTFPLMYQLLM